jgi:hypothetical protein
MLLTTGQQQKERLAQDTFDRLIEKEKTTPTQNHHQDVFLSTPPPQASASIPILPASPQQLFRQEPPLRHSTRQRNPVKRLIEGNMAASMDHMVHVCETISKITNTTDQAQAYKDFLRFDPDSGEYDPPTMAAFVASKTDPDTLRYHEAMMDDDAEGFREAMADEIKNLEGMGTWDYVARPQRDPLNPTRNPVLGGTWTFKKKRFPDWRLKQLRSRFCVRGDQQVEGVDYFESYAPVVQWSTVRVVFIMVIIYGLVSRQVDFQNASVSPRWGQMNMCMWKYQKVLMPLQARPPTRSSSSARHCTD